MTEQRITTNPADAIRKAVESAERARVELIGAVAAARARGCSWQDIADVFGVSRQAVWERFAKDMPEASK